MSSEIQKQEELKVFSSLGKFEMVFDVGARMKSDISEVPSILEYLTLQPQAQFHLFEPNPVSYQALRMAVGHHPQVIINNFGLGDKEGTFSYNKTLEAFDEGEAWQGESADKYLITTLDMYVKEMGIKQIDFLKIDTEGYDYKVLLGGEEARKITRYIQYEHWDNKEQFHTLLEAEFDMEYIGYRNVLCKRK